MKTYKTVGGFINKKEMVKNTLYGPLFEPEKSKFIIRKDINDEISNT